MFERFLAFLPFDSLPFDPDSSAWFVLGALVLVSVAALTVTLAKAADFLRRGVGRGGAAERVIAHWLAGEGGAALRLAEGRGTVRLRVLHAGLAALRARPDDREAALALAGQAAAEEMEAMTRHMRLLDGVVQAAPMLGLLGTVTGMIEAFARLAETSGAADPAVLAGGIWTALTTTAAGLGIAIVFYFVSIWFESRIAAERAALERLVSMLLHGRVQTAPAPRTRVPAAPPATPQTAPPTTADPTRIAPQGQG